MFQVLATLGAVIVLGCVLIPFFVGQAKLNKDVTAAQLARYTLFAVGDLVDFTEEATKETLPIELTEQYGKGPFVVVAVTEADEILRHVHPQFLLLRKRSDVMLVSINQSDKRVTVRFSGAQVRKYKKTKTTVFQTRSGKLTSIAG